MIVITDKHKCCGCEACVLVCPKHCISLQQDNEGFLYPYADKESCVECGLCQRVCPTINLRAQTLPMSVWAAQNMDKKVRRKSSSGGIATMFAESIVDKGGVIFGVVMNDNYEAVYTYAETKEQITAFCGSKYIQSRTADTFKQVRDFLNIGRKVLFIGAPCQVSGLKYYLKKNYENLFTIDFICHGVPSPGVFKWYIQDEINKYAISKGLQQKYVYSHYTKHAIPIDNIKMPDDLKFKSVQFRDKREGWKKYSFVLNFTETMDDGKQNTCSLVTNVCQNSFMKGFCSNLYLRPSCHQCPARSYRSGSDVTLGDFWGQEYMFPDFDNDTGVSCVIIKTEKGFKLFNSLKNIKRQEKTIEQVLAYNPSLNLSTLEPYSRTKFWKNVGKYSFEETVNLALNLSFAEKLLLTVKKLLR